MGVSWKFPIILPSGPTFLPRSFGIRNLSPWRIINSAWIILSYTGCWCIKFPAALIGSSISGMSLGNSSSSSYYSNESSLTSSGRVAGSSSLFGSLASTGVPHRDSSKTSHFIFSVSLLSYDVFRGQVVRRWTTFTFAFNTHCAISFPSPLAGRSKCLRNSRAKVKAEFYSLK